jgi:hexokinase|tara:strand:+ start:500 stop:862 length:363 start_codon:yes stop_codon:yes gene_type:complete
MKWKLLNIFYKAKGEKMAQVKNYSEKDVAFMTEQYTKNPTRDTVEMLAEKLGKNTRSIIAKLSREGVYVAQPRVTKAGEPVVLKGELVARIEKALGISVPSIVKATKMDLQTLADHLEAQ